MRNQIEENYNSERNVGSASRKRNWLSVRKQKIMVLFDVTRRASVCCQSASVCFLSRELHVRDACLHGQDSGVYLIRRTGLE